MSDPKESKFAKAEPQAELPTVQPAATTPEPAPVAEPAVEAVTKFEAGQKVIHANGAKYLVRYQTDEGVALEGVANLVHPSALKLA